MKKIVLTSLISLTLIVGCKKDSLNPNPDLTNKIERSNNVQLENIQITSDVNQEITNKKTSYLLGLSSEKVILKAVKFSKKILMTGSRSGEQYTEVETLAELEIGLNFHFRVDESGFETYYFKENLVQDMV